jgi:hypothetical protein
MTAGTGAALMHDEQQPAPEAHAAAPVFLSVPSGHNVSNLLRSGFLPSLLGSGVKVVVLSPFAADPTFVREFTKENVEIATLPPWHPTPAERAVDSLLSEMFLRQSRLEAVRLQRDRARLLEPWPGRSALAAVKAVLVRAPVPRRTWFRVAGALSRHAFDRLFTLHQPALLVTSSAGFLTSEVPVIYAAKRFGVPQIGVDLGWDNLVSKYHTILPVDRLAVWNDDMREQAIRFHGFSADRVAVVGAVQFDSYFESLQLPTREAFLKTAGVSPERALVTMATAPHAVYPSTPWLIEILADAIDREALGRPADLLVRVHPRDDLAQYSRFAGRRHVTIEKPVGHLVGTPGTPQFDQFSATRADRRHLAETLAYSDVLVNFASTTTIEACVFDTPVVNVGFDEHVDVPAPLSIRRYFRFEHYRPVVETGAATVASSPEGLVSAVRAYLADRTRDQEARRKLAARLCPFRDASAGQRLARAVLDALVPRPNARRDA